MSLPPPSQFVTTLTGLMTGTLGRAEREAAAALVIRLHHFWEHEDWQTFVLPDMAALLGKDEVTQKWMGGYAFARCTPDFRWLVENEYLLEGPAPEEGKVGPLTVTEKFTDAMKRWRKS